MEIPKLEGYFPSREQMNEEQLLFYKYMERKLLNNEIVDVKGNIGYVFVYLYDLLDEWGSKGFEDLSTYLLQLAESYKNEEKLSNYCQFWAYDCLLGLKKYDEFLNKTESRNAFGTNTHYSNLRLNISKYIGQPVNHIDVLLMAGGRKTKFIENNEAIYREKIQIVFEAFSNENNGWFDFFEKEDSVSNLYRHLLFSGAPMGDKPELDFKTQCFYAAYDQLKVIKQLSKDAENLAREELGIPKIGEGWVSETELYKKLQNTFSSSLVIQHGQPSWLGRQHYDIWFPHWKIAVEYHGKQHFEPVEFFGGQEAFLKTVERDKRKISLSKKNGVKLFVVTEDDNTDELIKNITQYQNSKKVFAPKT